MDTARTCVEVLSLAALVACGPSEPPLVLPPAPDLPIDVLADFEDTWVVDAAPLPGPVWQHHDAFDVPGPLPEGWQTVGVRPFEPTVVPLPDGQTGLQFGHQGGRAATMSGVEHHFAVPASDRVTARVRVRLDGDHQGLVAPPLLRLQAREHDPKTDKWKGLGQNTAVAAWTTEAEDGPWQTLATTLDLPRGAERLAVVLSPGIGRTEGTVTFGGLTVEAPSAAAVALTKPAVSPVLRPEAHPRIRSIRSGPDQRPSLVSATPETWVLPLPARTEPVRFRTQVSVPRTKLANAGQTCWRIRSIPSGAVEEAAQCHTVGSRWTPVTLDLPPAVTGLRFDVYPRQPDTPMAPVAWARPRVEVPTARTDDPRPDLVLVVVDTLRADGLGLTGAPNPASPELDRLAASMDRYTRAFAASSWTLPSLASVMTGRWPTSHGAGFRSRLLSSEAKRGSVEWKSRTFAPIAATVPLVSEQLQAAGYCTEAFVTNYFFGASFGFQRGFDRFTQYAGNSIPGAEHLTELVGGRDPCDGPRFTVLHLFEPHMPLRYRSDAPAGFVDDTTLEGLSLRQESAKDGRTARELHSLNTHAKDHPDTLRGLYDTETWHADRLLGALLDHIAPPGTGLIFLSDHGEHFGEHDRWGHGTSMYDELIRVPLLVRAPGREGAGRVLDHTVSLVDVAPTLLSWAGLPEAAHDGKVLGTDTTGRTVWSEYIYKGPETVTAIQDDTLVVRTLGRGTRDSHTSGRGPQWAATDEAFTLAEPRATPGDAVDATPLDAALSARLRETYPGIHIVCTRADTPTQHEWTTSRGTLVQVTPLQATKDDHIATDRNGRRATLTLAAGTEPLEVVVETVPRGPVHVGDGCTAVRVGAAATAATLDSDTVEALEAIGYMGD